MRKIFVFLALLTIVAMPVVAAKAQVDYDREFDFASIETFQFIEAEGGRTLRGNNPLMHDRMVEIIERTLVGSGLRKVESDPDIFVTYHVQTAEMSMFTTTSVGYGWGGGYRRWGGYGGGSATTRETRYTEGTLIVDAWNPQSKKLVWRGISAKTLKGQPEKRVKQVEKALEQMAQRFEKLQAGERR